MKHQTTEKQLRGLCGKAPGRGSVSECLALGDLFACQEHVEEKAEKAEPLSLLRHHGTPMMATSSSYYSFNREYVNVHTLCIIHMIIIIIHLSLSLSLSLSMYIYIYNVLRTLWKDSWASGAAGRRPRWPRSRRRLSEES